MNRWRGIFCTGLVALGVLDAVRGPWASCAVTMSPGARPLLLAMLGYIIVDSSVAAWYRARMSRQLSTLAVHHVVTCWAIVSLLRVSRAPSLLTHGPLFAEGLTACRAIRNSVARWWMRTLAFLVRLGLWLMLMSKPEVCLGDATVASVRLACVVMATLDGIWILQHARLRHRLTDLHHGAAT